MTDFRAAKRALARLADPSPVIDAEHALQDLDRAADFRESGGLDDLRRIAAAGNGRRVRRARDALAAFRRFQRAATGDAPDSGDVGSRGDDPHHFRRGRDTHLPAGGESPGND